MFNARSSRFFYRATALTAFCFAGSAVHVAEARPNIQRRGGQWGGFIGGSICVPGKAKCRRDAVSEGGVTVDGRTRPSAGLGAELGYRFNAIFFAGASYSLGFFDTRYDIEGQDQYKRAYQSSIHAIVRPTLPIWRIDLGLGLGPGFSRQTFVRGNGNKDYSQGFSWLFAPTLDVFVTRRIFVGAKVDLRLNAHRRTCRETNDTITCAKTSSRDLAPVHQMLFGLRVGGTFL